MKSLFIDIRQRIKSDAAFSGFYVDENFGQLDTETDFYQVDFPCILLDIVGTEWDNLVPGTQVGIFTVKASMAIDCKDEELGDSVDDRIATREEYFRRMHRLLHNFPAGNYTPLIRKSFQTHVLPGSIKVYECIYTCTSTESAAPLEKIPTEPLSVSIDMVNKVPEKFVVPDLEGMA